MIDEAPAEPQPRRQHRFVTVPSGVLPAACFFLPALQPCNKPMAPYEIAFFPPYALGLLVAVLAIVRAKPRRIMTLILRALGWFGLGCMVVATIVALTEGFHPAMLLSFAVVIALILVIGWEPAAEETAAARFVIATGLAGIGFFGLFLYDDPDSVLYGLYLSAAACVGLFIGGVEWRREVLRDRDTRELPDARVRSC